MLTTAEGVETVEQRDMLRELNCSQMQGFLLSRPRSGSEIIRMMSDFHKDRLAAGSQKLQPSLQMVAVGHGHSESLAALSCAGF